MSGILLFSSGLSSVRKNVGYDRADFALKTARVPKNFS